MMENPSLLSNSYFCKVARPGVQTPKLAKTPKNRHGDSSESRILCKWKTLCETKVGHNYSHLILYLFHATTLYLTMFFLLKVIKGWRTKRAKDIYSKCRVEALTLRQLQEEGIIRDDVNEIEAVRILSDRNKTRLFCGRLKAWIRRHTPQWLIEAGEDRKWKHFKRKLKTYGTIENFYAKSVVGFLCGILVTYVTFLFLAFPLAMPLTKATVMSTILGLPCMVLLAFNEATRCVVLMLIPHLFSSKGRQALAAYAIVLSFSEPGRNAIHNVRILSDSLACGQEKANELLKAVVALIKEPFIQIKKTMTDVLTRIKEVVKKVKGTVDIIKRVMSSIIGVIQTAFDWLNNVVGLCSKKLGTPFQRCTRAFDNAIDDCNAKLGSWFNWMCSIAYVTKTVCYVVKVIDYICELFEFVSDEIVMKARRRLREFVYHVRNLFYVSIDFSHESSYELAKSQDVSDVLHAIAEDFKRLFSELFGWLDGASVVFSFFIFYSIYRYRKKFLSREWFDNHFLTTHLIEIEVKRTQLERETIFPLSRWEKSKYIRLTSLKLVGIEKIKMAALIVLMAWLFAKIGLIVSADYSIWWLINKLKNYVAHDINIEGLSPIQVNVSDTGVMSDVYKGVVDSFQPLGLDVDVDTSSCVPAPADPTYFAYKQLAILVAFIFIMTLFQPYGQRLRVIIMNYYYPGIARRRAVWLYNNILRSRGSFLKYARRQLRRKYAHDTDIEAVSIQDRIFAVLPFLRLFFPKRKFEACLVCGAASRPDEPLMRCQTDNCVGLYCTPCFDSLQNVCTICKNPIDYGDMTDLSEERDSSDYYDKLEKDALNSGQILESELNVSEGYETEYDKAYMKEKRDPSDVPFTSIDLDSMESQRLTTDLADDSAFEIKDEQKSRDDEFLKSMDMLTLKTRLSSNPIKNVFSTSPLPPVTFPPPSRPVSYYATFQGTPRKSRVTLVGETDRSSSKSDQTSVSSRKSTHKCFLFNFFCKKKLKKGRPIYEEGTTSNSSDDYSHSGTLPSVKRQPSGNRTGGSPVTHIARHNKDNFHLLTQAKVNSRPVRKELETSSSNENAGNKRKTKIKSPGLKRSLAKLLPVERVEKIRKGADSTKLVVDSKYERVPSEEESFYCSSSSSSSDSTSSSTSGQENKSNSYEDSDSDSSSSS